MKTVILLPTIYRPDGLLRALHSIFTTIGHERKADIVVSCEKDDQARLYTSHVIETVVCQEEKQGPAYAWNNALRYLEKQGRRYDAYVLASDDVEFLPHWLDEALSVLQDKLSGSGLVGLNDNKGKYERAGFCTHYLMTRDFIVNHNGGVVCCPHYYADYTDVEIIRRAQKVNKFSYAPNAMLIHHWREVEDEAYKRADARRADAKTIFLNREVNGFPDDFEPIAK